MRILNFIFDRHGDSTVYDGITDWGDGTIDYKLSHTYAQRGTYVIQTKYWFNSSMNDSSVCKNITIYRLNKCMTNYDYLFYKIDVDRNKSIIENERQQSQLLYGNRINSIKNKSRRSKPRKAKFPSILCSKDS